MCESVNEVVSKLMFEGVCDGLVTTCFWAWIALVMYSQTFTVPATVIHQNAFPGSVSRAADWIIFIYHHRILAAGG